MDMIIAPPLSDQQRFYRSMPMACSYLPGEIERKLFTRLNGKGAQALNSTLTQAGFRRSHDIAYRPVCPTCSACTPVRIPIALYRETAGHRRIKRLNADLRSAVADTTATEEQFALFRSYQYARHSDGDMSQMNRSDYEAMIHGDAEATFLYEWRDQTGALKAAILTDRINDGLSAVYSFFDPHEARRSLGIYMILHLIEAVKQAGHDYVYLGYYIRGSRKMDYKARFHPLEALGPLGWQLWSE